MGTALATGGRYEPCPWQVPLLLARFPRLRQDVQRLDQPLSHPRPPAREANVDGKNNGEGDYQ